MRFVAGAFTETEATTGLQALAQKGPQWLIDLRTDRAQRVVVWAGDELPVYHAGDVLDGLCTWEDATYPTSVENLTAVYPPAVGATLPQTLPALPTEATIVFLDAAAVDLVAGCEGERWWCGETAPEGWTPVPANDWARGGKAKGFWRRWWENRKQP